MKSRRQERMRRWRKKGLGGRNYAGEKKKRKENE